MVWTEYFLYFLVILNLLINTPDNSVKYFNQISMCSSKIKQLNKSGYREKLVEDKDGSKMDAQKCIAHHPEEWVQDGQVSSEPKSER